jgi:uncharacterized protein (DUF1778 family)
MTAAAKRRTLNLRVGAEERDLIDRAARAQGTNRTDFILTAARRAAEETLLDRALLAVGPAAYAAFVAQLDAPTSAAPAAKARLRRTMQAPPPWKKRA